MYIYGSYRELRLLCDLANKSTCESVVFAGEGDIWFIHKKREPIYFKSSFHILKDAWLTRKQFCTLMDHVVLAKRGFETRAEYETLHDYTGEVVRITPTEILLDEKYIYQYIVPHNNAYAHEIRKLREDNLRHVKKSSAAEIQQILPVINFEDVRVKLSAHKEKINVTDNIPVTREPLEIYNDDYIGAYLQAIRFPEFTYDVPGGYTSRSKKESVFRVNHHMLSYIKDAARVVTSTHVALTKDIDRELLIAEMYDSQGSSKLHFRAVYDEKTLTLRSLL